MGGAGYSVQSEWKDKYNETILAARFNQWNVGAAVAINTYVNGNPSSDVGSSYTNTAKLISDQMIMVECNFLKESGMTNPPEFIHYKFPHFTPLHMELLTILKAQAHGVGRWVF